MKFKIFISSVQGEFAKARLAIAEMVRKDRLLSCFFETFVFEEGTARDRKARNVYLDAVADCDIVDKCKNWGLGTPEYYPETSDFKTVIWRRGFGPNALSEPSDSASKGLQKGLQKGPQSWPQSWPQSTDNKILSLLYFSDLSIKELASKLDVTTKTGSFRVSITRLLDDQLIEFTFPDLKTNRNQKYRLTKKARRLLLAL